MMRNATRGKIHNQAIHHDIQRQALHEVHCIRGLDGDIDILFPNGACVCTIRLRSRELVRAQDVPGSAFCPYCLSAEKGDDDAE
jgi:hypothetical protein